MTSRASKRLRDKSHRLGPARVVGRRVAHAPSRRDHAGRHPDRRSRLRERWHRTDPGYEPLGVYEARHAGWATRQDELGRLKADLRDAERAWARRGWRRLLWWRPRPGRR